jgi:hypothetical protein
MPGMSLLTTWSPAKKSMTSRYYPRSRGEVEPHDFYSGGKTR